MHRRGRRGSRGSSSRNPKARINVVCPGLGRGERLSDVADTALDSKLNAVSTCHTPASEDSRLPLIGISLASIESAMSEMSSPSTYNEPTVMWRMTHRDGRWAQAVFDPLTSGARVQWFVNGHSLALCDFADWTSAIEWSDRLRAQQWTVGWRLSDDIPEEPSSRSGS